MRRMKGLMVKLGCRGQRGGYRKRILGRVDEAAEIVFFKFFFGATGDLFGDIGPVAEARSLRRLDEKKLLIGAPLGVDDGQRALLDDPVGMPGMFRRVCRKACVVSTWTASSGWVHWTQRS
jgi:hypothetical protein